MNEVFAALQNEEIYKWSFWAGKYQELLKEMNPKTLDELAVFMSKVLRPDTPTNVPNECEEVENAGPEPHRKRWPQL